jgi:hypothetical protein
VARRSCTMFALGTGGHERRRHRDRERDRKDKDKDKDRDKDRDREKERQKKHLSRPSTRRKTSSASTSTKERDGDSKRERSRERDRDSVGKERKRDTTPESKSSKGRMGSIVPEMERRPSMGSPGISKYPSFSKAHSKEAVGSRENIVNPRMSLYTPDPTDLGSESFPKKEQTRPATAGAAPPSPPLTVADEPDLRRAKSGNSIRKTPEKLKLDTSRRPSLDGARPRAMASRSASASTLRKEKPSTPKKKKDDASERAKAFAEVKPNKHHVATESSSATTTPDVKAKSSTQFARAPEFSVVTEATSESTATSVQPPKRAAPPPPPPPPVAVLHDDSSPTSANDSSPRTPTPHDPVFPQAAKQAPVVEVFTQPSDAYPSPYSVPGSMPVSAGGPPPPPPPPAPQAVEMPRVDYLLQNGGLPRLVPRKFLSALGPTPAPPAYGYQGYGSPAFVPGQQQSTMVNHLFAPFINVLDDYMRVMEKHGSLAVATGYRSVARRLLDRLEAVFNRNISSETCDCIMCQTNPPSPESSEDETGVSWGEILEFVAGRRELPQWPPFTISPEALASAPKLDAPFQKIDIDVPDEYREHYIKQGKKTKETVQAWLACQPDMPSSPPQEVDDETLIFAMVTHLEPDNRRLFTALLRGLSTIPASRAPTPANAAKAELMGKTALALQRLYRLAQAPRDPECAMFLLKNPELHSVLATLSAISTGEWDILISGRFDGFLWSGADSPSVSRGPSRGPTPVTPASQLRSPFGNAPSRNGTPFSPAARPPNPPPTPANRFGAPVQLDEDTEIAVLAEIEREIYTGMEALEDAFEMLHSKAEAVRTVLRARGAGLSMAASTRRGSIAEPAATMGTPNLGSGAWGAGFGGEGILGVDALADDDWDGGRSELAPDDSASNISFARRRRKHREHGKDRERRTPAPVEEEDEESVIEIEERGRKGSVRRR